MRTAESAGQVVEMVCRRCVAAIPNYPTACAAEPAAAGPNRDDVRAAELCDQRRDVAAAAEKANWQSSTSNKETWADCLISRTY